MWGHRRVFVFDIGKMSACHVLMRMPHCGGRGLQWAQEWEEERWLEQSPAVDKRWRRLHTQQVLPFHGSWDRMISRQEDSRDDGSMCMWMGGAGSGSLGGSLRVAFLFFFIFVFIYGCVGSSFLCEGFLRWRRAGTTLHRGARTSHCRGLSCCGAQAPDAQAQQLWLMGLVAPRHVGSSQTRARTRVPCIGRQIPNHCATREAPGCFSWCNKCKIILCIP